MLLERRRNSALQSTVHLKVKVCHGPEDYLHLHCISSLDLQLGVLLYAALDWFPKIRSIPWNEVLF